MPNDTKGATTHIHAHWFLRNYHKTRALYLGNVLLLPIMIIMLGVRARLFSQETLSATAILWRVVGTWELEKNTFTQILPNVFSFWVETDTKLTNNTCDARGKSIRACRLKNEWIDSTKHHRDFRVARLAVQCAAFGKVPMQRKYIY